MQFYHINLAILVAICTGLLAYRGYARRQNESLRDALPNQALPHRAVQLQQHFLLVYSLAVAADWLQGPCTYAVYKYEKQLPEKTVALLYASGFISGALSSSFVGHLADFYGRRAACLAYCLCYSLTCLTMLSDNLTVLYIGRIFGGIATTLLFSVFETWMVAQHRALQLVQTTLHLSSIFSKMTEISSVIAIFSGVASDCLFMYFGSRLWAFAASLLCCLGAAVLISVLWQENYGVVKVANRFDMALLETIYSTLLTRRVMALAFISCCFEGSMYIFVFFWSAALKSARSNSAPEGEPPFGLIFSSFMCAMMAGSHLSCFRQSSSTTPSAMRRLMLIIAIASMSFSMAATAQQQHILFWAFCVIEVCVGAYLPNVALIKSEGVGETHRGCIYSLLRLPLNLFIVIAHSLDQEGDEHRKSMFLMCAGLLLSAVVVLGGELRSQGEGLPEKTMSIGL